MALRVDALNGYANASTITLVYSAWTQALVDPQENMSLKDIVQLLNVARNKMTLLWLMKRSDWMQILGLLPKELLVSGLQFFDRDKLLAQMMHQPADMIMKMMYSIYTPTKLVKKMPLNDLMHILRAPQLDNRALIHQMQGMDPRFLKQLMCTVYGMTPAQAERTKPSDMWNLFFHTPKRRLMDGFKTLPYEALQPFVTSFLEQDKDLLGFVSGAFVDQVFDGVGKGQLMEACTELPEDQLIGMLSQLPDKFLIQVADQVDDNMFMDYMVANQAGLLRTLAAA